MEVETLIELTKFLDFWFSTDREGIQNEGFGNKAKKWGFKRQVEKFQFSHTIIFDDLCCCEEENCLVHLKYCAKVNQRYHFFC